MNKFLVEDQCPKRCLQQHLQQCDEIMTATNSTLKTHLETTYGITGKSPLLELINFDITKQVTAGFYYISLLNFEFLFWEKSFYI